MITTTINVIGRIELDPQLLRDAVAELKTGTELRYRHLLKEVTSSRESVINDTAHKSFGSLTLLIPYDCLIAAKEGYVVYYREKTDHLVDSHLKTVVCKIAAKIQELGFPADFVEINFETAVSIHKQIIGIEMATIKSQYALVANLIGVREL